MIRINKLTKKYVLKTGFIKRTTKIVEALININLIINQHETVGLIGLNGAGKSTLLKVILGILKPDSGEVTLLGKDAVTYRQQNMMQVGVVFGQRSQLKWDVSPLDSYLLNKALYKIDDYDFNTRLNKYAEILDIKTFWQRPVRTLSLGQKMRAELLMSILHHPKVLILDEPTMG